jgi:hypothetical protein
VLWSGDEQYGGSVGALSPPAQLNAESGGVELSAWAVALYIQE